jgi:hypothetical protein
MRCDSSVNSARTRDCLKNHTRRQLIAAAGDRAALRFLEFFTVNIRNPHAGGFWPRRY